MPDCGDLPESIDEESKNGFLKKVKSVWSAVKFLSGCADFSIVFEGALQGLINYGVQKLVEILTDLFENLKKYILFNLCFTK